jgi:hypothetical protein
MTTHSRVSKVQERGSSALFNLALNESVVVRMGVEGVVAALEQNPRNIIAGRALRRIRALINLD